MPEQSGCDHDWEIVDISEDYELSICLYCSAYRYVDKVNGTDQIEESEVDGLGYLVEANAVTNKNKPSDQGIVDRASAALKRYDNADEENCGKDEIWTCKDVIQFYLESANLVRGLIAEVERLRSKLGESGKSKV